MSLNIDPKYANQQLRTSLILPNGTGKSIRIAVFTEADYVPEVLKNGATIAGSDDLLEEINKGNINEYLEDPDNERYSNIPEYARRIIDEFNRRQNSQIGEQRQGGNKKNKTHRRSKRIINR